ncbi:hypothetical protein Q3G72_030096 [Acer saccharum]|nr:hypothetical protein Q3G72_030096 [Acer saccharum]
MESNQAKNSLLSSHDNIQRTQSDSSIFWVVLQIQLLQNPDHGSPA